MKKLIFFGLLMTTITFVVAQDWQWPKDVATAKEKNAIYTDAVKSKDFATAKAPHQWLLDNAPNLNKSLYINGAKIYQGLATATTDATQKVAYQEKALSMYDLRVQYFGGEANVLNRKAFTAYKYYKGTKAKYQELLTLFDKTFELNQAKTLDNNLMAYMDVVRRFKKSGGNLSDEAIIDRYGKISDVINQKISTGKNVSRLATIQANVDKLLTSTVTVDCPFVENKLVPKMRESKDSKMAKKVFQLMLTAKCSDSPSFIEAAELVHKHEPAFGLAKVIATKYAGAGDLKKASIFYDQALELAENNIKKAEIYMSKAQMYATKGQKIAARTNARKALASDPFSKKGYTLIGNLYMQSYEECKQGMSRVDDRLVFLAAYNQYKKANNTGGMAKAKAQFPSIGEIFELGLEEGKAMTVGCWINESVVLQRRPNESSD